LAPAVAAGISAATPSAAAMSKFAKASNEYHYTDPQDEDVGPVSLAEMRTAWVEGSLNAQSFVWHPTMVRAGSRARAPAPS
jgi:hypothetical protein